MKTRVALLAVVSMLLSSCALLGIAPDCAGQQVIANFRQVGDLVVNGNVQSSDVRIGNIQDIELDGWEARVTMCLDAGERISSNIKAVVRTTSLLGEKFIDLQELSPGPPFLEDGDVLTSAQTDKAAELEDVFAKLAAVLGTGNLEQINRLTHSQATILRGNALDLREGLNRLRRFTDLLAGRKDTIAASVDSLNSVAGTVLNETKVLQDFLASFADSSGVLAQQKEGLERLLLSLDQFSSISVQLLRQTQTALNEQFADLRPVLRTLVENSAKLREALTTLATFAEWWPESMPGDYLQLDVCQAAPEDFGPGDTCPQDARDDDPDGTGSDTERTGSLELIFRNSTGGGR